LNIYRSDDGYWRSYVQVRRQTNPELVEVIERSLGALEAYPDTVFWREPSGRLWLHEGADPVPHGDPVQGGSYALYTRIYLGVTPPTGHEPGYCAVVGELFDDSFEPHQRPLFALDEGVCFPDVDPSMALVPDLLEATCALKDIYLPAHEREGSSGLGGDRRLILNPGHAQFLEELRKTQHGICAYPEEEDVPDGRMAERFPFFASRDRIAPLYEPPYREDEDYGLKVVEAMMSRTDRKGRPMLRHHACCEVLRTSQYRTPLRALSLCCLSLQTYDWTEALEGRFDYDGYERDDEKERPESGARNAERRRDALLMGLLYQASDTRDRAVLEKEGLKAYLKAVGVPEGALVKEVSSTTAP